MVRKYGAIRGMIAGDAPRGLFAAAAKQKGNAMEKEWCAYRRIVLGRAGGA